VAAGPQGARPSTLTKPQGRPRHKATTATHNTLCSDAYFVSGQEGPRRIRSKRHSASAGFASTTAPCSSWSFIGQRLVECLRDPDAAGDGLGSRSRAPLARVVAVCVALHEPHRGPSGRPLNLTPSSRDQAQIDQPAPRREIRSQSSSRSGRYWCSRSHIRQAPCRSPSGRTFASIRRHLSV
jgi:hypothetical protein